MVLNTSAPLHLPPSEYKLVPMNTMAKRKCDTIVCQIKNISKKKLHIDNLVLAQNVAVNRNV